MNADIELVKVEAQQVLDELFEEALIPFKLQAREVNSVGTEELVIRFHDSRLRSIDISCKEGESFKDVFRAAMLDQVGRLEGPYKNKELVRNAGGFGR